MAKVCTQPLRSNPFNTYRDPKTGEWVVVVDSSSSTPREQQGSQAPSTNCSTTSTA
ncbi:MAG: hypothetical protein ACRC8A_02070 [Microcoleaceae cyanobacterium]